MMYLTDFEKELFELKKQLLINPNVKNDFSNVLVSIDIVDGKEYLHYTLVEDL